MRRCETHRPHGGSHSSGPWIAPRLEQPTRTVAGAVAVRTRGETPLPPKEARRPYSALLRVGFAMRFASRRPRCALTAPFHPCSPWGERSALCGTFPEIALGGRYPPPLFRGARTFLATFARTRLPSLLAKQEIGERAPLAKRKGWNTQRRFCETSSGVRNRAIARLARRNANPMCNLSLERHG